MAADRLELKTKEKSLRKKKVGELTVDGRRQFRSAADAGDRCVQRRPRPLYGTTTTTTTNTGNPHQQHNHKQQHATHTHTMTTPNTTWLL